MRDKTSLSTVKCSKNSLLINRVLLITACFMPLGFFPFPGIDIFDVVKGPLITLSALTLAFSVYRDKKKFDKSLVTKLLIAYLILVLLASIFAINPLFP